ncbi:MAG TPA: protein-tyrosine-phosphatase [Rhodoblastus sp.]|mgnify:CR=1 FL=1|nr:protein-tyrosine-phosphatase [Rhodoblastus sp.]
MSDHRISLLTVCGIAELPEHDMRGVTDVLSILDPDMPEPAAFAAWPTHRRQVLRFSDEIAERPGAVLPTARDVAAILGYGRGVATHPGDKHVLVHCHMGMSRSTAAMGMLIAQDEPDLSGDEVFARVYDIRKRSWPNSLMVRMADDALGRGGDLFEAMRRLYGRQLVNFPTYAQSLRAIGRGAEVDMAIAP